MGLARVVPGAVVPAGRGAVIPGEPGVPGGAGQGVFVDHDAQVRGGAVPGPAVPASRAAWQAAVRPSIRRCAAVRVSSVPRGSQHTYTAVLMISADAPSPHAPEMVPVSSRVMPNDR